MWRKFKLNNYTDYNAELNGINKVYIRPFFTS
jgi:hypothetical protein